MTADEKKERRQVRRELTDAVIKNHFGRDFKLSATPRQMKAAARKITDQLLAGKNPHMAVRHEA